MAQIRVRGNLLEGQDPQSEEENEGSREVRSIPVKGNLLQGAQEGLFEDQAAPPPVEPPADEGPEVSFTRQDSQQDSGFIEPNPPRPDPPPSEEELQMEEILQREMQIREGQQDRQTPMRGDPRNQAFEHLRQVRPDLRTFFLEEDIEAIRGNKSFGQAFSDSVAKVNEFLFAPSEGEEGQDNTSISEQLKGTALDYVNAVNRGFDALTETAVTSPIAFIGEAMKPTSALQREQQSDRIQSLRGILPISAFIDTVTASEEREQQAAEERVVMDILESARFMSNLVGDRETANQLHQKQERLYSMGLEENRTTFDEWQYTAGSALVNLRNSARASFESWRPNVEEGFWNSVVPQTLGTAGGFLVLGAPSFSSSGAVQMGRAGLPLMSGYESYADMTEQDALNHGADFNSAKEARRWGGAVGMFSFLPMFRAAGRINHASRNAIGRRIDNVRRMSGSVREPALAIGYRAAIEEGLKEAVVMAGQNVIASDIVGYDPTRRWSENVAEAALGGAMGGGFAAGIGAGLATRPTEAEEIRRRRTLLQETDPSLDPNPSIPAGHDNSGPGQAYSFGVHSLVQLLPEKLRRGQQKNLELAERMEQHRRDFEAEGRALSPSFERDLVDAMNTLSRQAGVSLQSPEDVQNFLNRFKNTPLSKSDDQANLTLQERLEANNGVAVFSEDISETRRSAENWAQMLERAKENNESQETINGIEGILRQKLTDHKRWVQQMREVQGIVSRIKKNLGLNDINIIISDGAVGKNLQLTNGFDGKSRTNGVAGALSNNTFKIELNLRGPSMQGTTSRMTNEMRSKLRRVVAHEMGHVIHMREFRKADNNTRRAIAAAYVAWAQRTRNSTVGEFFNELAPSDMWAKNFRRLIPDEHPTPESNLFSNITGMNVLPAETYLMSPQEFFAESVAQIISTGKMDTEGLSAPSQRFFRKMASMTKKLLTRKGLIEYQAPIQDHLNSLSAIEQIRQGRTYAQQKPNIIRSRIEAVRKFLGDEAVADLPEAQTDLDKYNKFIKFAANLLQLQRVNQHIPFLNEFVEGMRNYNRVRGKWLERSQETYNQLKKLSRSERKVLEEWIYKEQDLERALREDELPEGVTDRVAEAREIIDRDMKDVLQQMEEVTIRDIESIPPDTLDDASRQEKIRDARERFEKLRNRRYFPMMRFGKFTAVAKDSKGKTIAFETYETRAQREFGVRRLRQEYPDLKIGRGKLANLSRSFMGIPRPLIEQMEQRMELNAKQRQELGNLLAETAPAESHLKRMMRRRKTPGFSRDVIRAYSAYMYNAAGQMAKITEGREMEASLANGQRNTAELRRQGLDTTNRDQIIEHMDAVREYVMNPANEWGGLRALGFTWYLGWNPKSALVNSTQIPLVALPYLSNIHGDGKSIGALNKAIRDATFQFTRDKKLSEDEQRMIDKLTDQQVLDHTLAATLASAKDEEHTGLAMPVGITSESLRTVQNTAAYLFHNVEKFNRRITALAAYRLARDAGESENMAIRLAGKAVEDTQFEYSRWNKPAYMRGKAGVVTLFLNYVHNAMYFAFGNHPGKMRHWAVLAMMSGVMGLPFAEDIANILDWVLTKSKEVLGLKNPRTHIRLQMRDFLNDITDNPDVVLNGLASQSMGIGTAGRALDLPVPEVDISGSTSMGRTPLPTDLLQSHISGADFSTALQRSMENVTGAVWGGMIEMGDAAWSPTGEDFKLVEAFLPKMMQAASSTARLSFGDQEGRLEAGRGELIASYDLEDRVDQATLIFRAMGFPATREGRGWERYITEREVIGYYEARRRMALRRLAESHITGDEEDRRKAVQSIRTYNKTLPDGMMGISPADMSNAIKNRMRTRLRTQFGVQGPMRNLPARQRIREVFEEPSRDQGQGGS